MSDFIEVLSEKSKQDLDQFLVKLETALKSVSQINQQFKGITVPSGMKGGASGAAKAQSDSNAMAKESIRLSKALATAEARLAQQETNLAKQVQSTRDQYNRRNRQIRDEQRLLRRSEGIYSKIQAKIAVLSQEYNNLAARKEMGLSLDAKQEGRLLSLTDRLNRYQNVLKKVDSQIGKNQRNVGNYASGWNGLANSINQISREMPAFAYSTQTGFLALSNNIPILIDEINRLKVANQQLIAQGKPVTSVFSQIIRQVFSWQTAMSLAITLSVIYGKELGNWVSRMIDASRGISSAERALEEFNNSLVESRGSLITERIALEELTRVALDNSESLDKRNQAWQIIQDKYPERLGNLDLEKSSHEAITTAVQEQVKALDQRAKFMAAEEILSAAYQKVLKEQVESTKTINQLTTDEAAQKQRALNIKQLRETKEAYEQFLSSLSDTERESPRFKEIISDFESDISRLENSLGFDEASISELAKQYKENFVNEKIASDQEMYEETRTIIQDIINETGNLFDLFGLSSGAGGADKAKKELNTLYDLVVSRLERRLELEREAIDDEEKGYKDRLAFVDSYVAQAQLLERVLFDERLRLALKDVKNVEDRKNIKTRLEEEYQHAITNIDKKGAEDREGIYDDEFARLKKGYDNLSEEQQQALDYQLINLRKNMMAQKKSTEDIEEELTDVKREELRKQLKDKLEYLFKELKAAAKTKEQEAEVYKKIAKLRKELFDLDYEEYEDKSEEEIKRINKIKDAFSSLGNQLGIDGKALGDVFLVIDEGFENAGRAAEAFGTLVNQVFTSIMAAENRRLEAQMQALETQLEVERAFAAEGEAARVAIEERFAEKKRKIQEEQARNDKAQAIMQSVIATAVAVTKALTIVPGGVALAAVIGALGAAQTAIIASTPIPQFAEGVQNFEGGQAIVGDGGKREPITDKSGKLIGISPAKPTLVNLPKGANVYPSELDFYRELNGVLNQNGIEPSVTIKGSSLTEENVYNAMKKAIGSRPTSVINMDKNGFSSYIYKKNMRIKEINNKGHFRSKSV